MNKMKYKIGIWSLLLLFACFGCNDDDNTLVVPQLSVGEKTLNFDESLTQTLAIEANGHWTAAAIRDTAEFIVSPSEGYGNGTVTITLSRTKPEAINGYLKVTYMDGTDEGLEVAQGVRLRAGAMDWEVYPREVAFNSAAGYTQQMVRISTPGKWTATLSDTTWCTLGNASGENEGYVTLNLKSGRTPSEEGVELIITPESAPRMEYVVNVTDQQGHEWEKYVTLNRATVGKGIDIVAVGMFFLEEDLQKGGRFDQACQLFMQWVFAMEPYKSYKDYFNVYAIPYTNEFDRDLMGFGQDLGTEDIETSFGTYLPPNNRTESSGFTINGVQQRAIYKYAYENSPVKADKGIWTELLVSSLVCTDDRAIGVVAQSNNVNRDPDCGIAHAAAPIFGGDLTTLFGHELMGHGFGGFCENYFSGSATYPESEKAAFMEHQRTYQTRLDISMTGDTSQFVNRAWVELYRMGYRNVDIIEGAQNMAYGVWRASGVGVMGNGNLGSVAGEVFYYNPVQRELILRQIYKLAGLEEEYSLQTFLDYDQNNATNIRTDQEMIDYYESHRKD